MLDIPTARALLHRTRPRRAADGYPLDVRTQVTELAAAEVAAGRSVTATARALGIAGPTLSRWLEASGEPTRRPGFVPVVLRSSTAVATPASEAVSGRLAVVTPSGFRVEGLDLDGVVTVLQRLS